VLGLNDEAITTPLTFAATANAIVYRGAQPIFADIDAATLNLAPDAVKRVATARTRALPPVDFAGLPCEYAHLLPLAHENGWIVIADAAHSFGGPVGDRRVGALADMTTLSFHPANLITTGEGGAVITDRDGLAKRLRAVRHHGIRRGDAKRPWRSARAGQQLPAHRLPVRARALAAWQARSLLAAARGPGSPLSRMPGRLPLRGAAGASGRSEARLAPLRRHAAPGASAGDPRHNPPGALCAENIGATMHYPLVYRHRFYRDCFRYTPGLCPNAELVEPRLVTLPLFPAMTDADQDDVLRALDKVFAHYAR
jgi:perosamine synthetase